MIGAPSRTRTCDLLVRSQTLYPTELWARTLLRADGPRPGLIDRTETSILAQRADQALPLVFVDAARRGALG